jgi:alpha-L-fucosidase
VNRRTFVARSAAACYPWRMPRVRWQTARARPSPAQLAWQRDERAMFLHFGVNTFTDREWGDGSEDPNVFAPTQLDTRQWARTARAAGFRAMILTAKHHDGFCLWPTATTTHSVASSRWREGHGDVVRDFTDACRAEGLRAGLYLSPWDRNNPSYGDSPAYNDLYCAQLTELLTRYGTISEVWFDGANGEGPNGKHQVYDWPRFFALVHQLQPDAVIFSDAGPDVRWCGNESGTAGDPDWSPIDPALVPYPGASGPGITDALQHGTPNGTVWRPAEVDVSIRPGWFYHRAQDAQVRSPANLVDLYFSSVGRNGKLLLNVPPTRDGVLAVTDVDHLNQMQAQLRDLFDHDLAEGRHPGWRLTGPRTAEATIELRRPTRISVIRLREQIARGQAVARFSLFGADTGGWSSLVSGTTIGYTRLLRIDPVVVRQLRLVIDDAVAVPDPVSIGIFAG